MKILREALIALNDWVMDGLPEHDIFKSRHAICDNVRNFINFITHDKRYKSDDQFFNKLYGSMGELEELFLGYGAENAVCPFNYNMNAWVAEKNAGTFYINFKRLDFLKKHGTRTISDCVPLALRIENPEILIIANVYLRGEDVYCLPKLWWCHPRLGIIKIEDFAVKQRARSLLSSLGVKLNY